MKRVLPLSLTNRKRNSEGDEDASDVGDEIVDAASSEEEEEEAEGAASADVVTRSKEQQDVEGDHQQRIALGGSCRAGGANLQQDDDNNNIVMPEGKKGAALSVHEIDAHWLQLQLSTHFSEDVDVCAKIADDVLNVLELRDVRECENKLLVLLGFDLFEFIKVLLSHRLLIWACIKLKRAKNDETKQAIEEVVKRSDPSVWNDLYSNASVENWTQDRMTRTARETKKEARQLNAAGDTTNIRCEVGKDNEVQ
jgi:pre-mRNA-splicing helicase BRR2